MILYFFGGGKILVGEGEVSGGIEGRRTLEWRSGGLPPVRGRQQVDRELIVNLIF